MSEIKANHICKNPECRKEYYACNYCTNTLNWRSVACSFECYQKYTDLVIAERSKGKAVKIIPERIDMTENEVIELMNRPTEEVLKETKEQLEEYITDDNADISSIVDEINKELDVKKSTSTRSKKKSVKKDE